MRLFRHYKDFPAECRGSVVVLGNFDGFHRGHQQVIAKAGRLAREMQTTVTVVTMEPHPRYYFNPDQEDFRLTSFRTKAQLLENFGVDQMVVLPFDQEMAVMQAQAFVLDVLVGALGALQVVVGYDYCFGRGRGGGITVLKWMGHMEGFGVTVIDKVMEGDQVYSSSNIRESLRQGKVRDVASRLGHWWQVEGHVYQGDQRGRTIGFPTANISMDGYLRPRHGVYAVRVSLPQTERVYDGVANVGARPTFDKKDVNLEVFLFDFDDDLYNALLRVQFIDFIRGEQKFSGIDELKQQIAQDCIQARAALAMPENRADVLPIVTIDDEHLLQF